MAQIDKFLARMVESGASRAELIADQPGTIYVHGQQVAGPVITAAQLRNAVLEITPDDLLAGLGGTPPTCFLYASPNGTFHFQVTGADGALRVAIDPAAKRLQQSSGALAPPAPVAASPGTKPCPHCGEPIKAAAKKCRFCGEWLDPLAMSGRPNPSDLATPSRAPTASRVAPALGGTAPVSGLAMTPRDHSKTVIWFLLAVMVVALAVQYWPKSSGVTAPPMVPLVTATPTPQGLKGERFPQTRMRLMTTDEIDGLSLDDLQYAINEMYARHGFAFRPEKAKPFVAFPWYKPIKGRTQDKVEQDFNSFEHSNYRSLIARRNQMLGQSEASEAGPDTPPAASNDTGSATPDRMQSALNVMENARKFCSMDDEGSSLTVESRIDIPFSQRHQLASAIANADAIITGKARNIYFYLPDGHEFARADPVNGVNLD